MNQTIESDFLVDDYPASQIADIPMWCENYAINCCDAATGIGFIANLGRLQADPTIWREAVTIALPGERIICIKNYGRSATAKIASASLFNIEVIKPGNELRLTYNGPAVEATRENLLKDGLSQGSIKMCQFDLHFTGATPLWNISGHADEGADVVGSLHIEQIGKGNGFIHIGDEKFQIKDGFMNRDHSRGTRILDKFKRSFWSQGHFREDDISFSVFAIELFGMDQYALSRASVTQDGKRFDANIEYVDMLENNDDAGNQCRFVISSELGKMEVKTARILTSAPLTFVNPWDIYHGVLPNVPFGLLFEEAVIWEWQGKQDAGWAERSIVHQPFQGFL